MDAVTTRGSVCELNFQMLGSAAIIRTDCQDIAVAAAGACPTVEAGPHSASQQAAAVANGPAHSTPSLRSLLRLRSSSCGHRLIANGHTVLSPGGVTNSVFTTISQQATKRDADSGPPAADTSFVQLTRGGVPVHPPPMAAHGSVSERGAAFMQPKPGPTTQLHSMWNSPFLNSEVTRQGGDEVVSPALLPAIELNSLCADAAATAARFDEREVQVLLQPCGDPWQNCGASRPAGVNMMPSSATSHLDIVGDDSEEDQDYIEIGNGYPGGLAIDASAGRNETDRGPPLDVARVPPPTARGQRFNRKRACESGYTNSAPVDVATAAKREIENRFLQNKSISPALAGRYAIAGALSAPTAATTKTTQRTAAPSAASTAARLGDSRGDRLTPEDVAADSVPRPAGVASASKPAAQAGRPTATPHSVARKTPSSARSMRLSVLNAATPPQGGAAWPVGSARASHSIVGLGPTPAFPDVYEKRSIGSSNYFGSALAVGMSSLLDIIATDRPSFAKPEQACRRPFTPGREGAWARARQCVHSVGSRMLMGCFSGGAASPRG